MSQITHSFDRGIDYLTMKQKLIDKFNEIQKEILNDNTYYDNCKKNKLIYLLIAMIQLRNGSRITEACSAFREFYKNKNFNDKVVIKIAKSEGLKYNRAKKQKIQMKARFRHIMFPKWIDTDNLIVLNDFDDFINDERLRKRVLDFLLANFNCNTHSLRYSFINYMLMVKKTPMNIVSKFVGHTTVAQLVTYTQQKNVEALFDEEM